MGLGRAQQAEEIFLRDGTGWVLPLDIGRWPAGADACDMTVVRRCARAVLDIGCGLGRLVERGHEVLGIDISPPAVDATAGQPAPPLTRRRPSSQRRPLPHRIAPHVRRLPHPRVRGTTTAAGRTKKEIIRLLKRAIAREMFRCLTTTGCRKPGGEGTGQYDRPGFAQPDQLGQERRVRQHDACDIEYQPLRRGGFR
ncbi:hypothetical protein [Streptomyces sp. NBC_01310]|uniref:hypothetical protein n=1 Tax=Streptomyces sp. NBC_01310 TaxID=2903820 RepID=UPI003F4BEF93